MSRLQGTGRRPVHCGCGWVWGRGPNWGWPWPSFIFALTLALPLPEGWVGLTLACSWLWPLPLGLTFCCGLGLTVGWPLPWSFFMAGFLLTGSAWSCVPATAGLPLPATTRPATTTAAICHLNIAVS